MEMVDIVDENDQVIDKVSKQEAHEKGLLHRTIISEVKNDKGEWVLVKQASDRQDAGQYVSPVGGHIRAGESKSDALKREALEEVGVTDFTHKYIGKTIYNRKVLNRIENHYFILYEIYTDQPITLNHESDSYKFYSKDEIRQKLTSEPEIFGEAFHFVVKTFYPDLIST